MSSENAGSVASSGATSNKPQPPKKKNDLSEADFLADQQAKAKAAMDTAVADMKRAISNAFKDNAHLTEWMGSYPWVSLGLGAAVGFLAGSALTPARDETFRERLESLIEEVKRKEVKEEKAQKGTEKAARAAVDAQKPSFMEHVASGLFDILKTALVSTLSGAVAGKMAEDDNKPGNGQNGETGADY
jgi:ElaB/YqjD/DUF883 family membrane-anchored ribosome-binding protein